MSSKKVKLFESAWRKAAYATPGNPAELTDEEHELLLKLIRSHPRNCTETRYRNCKDRGGYLRGKPWYGDNPELARRIGIRV